MAVLLLLLSFTAAGHGQAVTGTTNQGLVYSAENGQVTITGITGYDGSQKFELSIPDAIDGQPVTAIGSGAFLENQFLSAVTIPDSVTSIGDSAFYDCRSLKSATISGSLTSIGDRAFFDCNGLTSITIPDSVTSIEAGAFEGCTGLTSVTIPGGVTKIGLGAFSECTGLASITISDGVTAIGDHAFYYCIGLTSVTIPSSVTSIGNSAFDSCRALASVTIPGSVTSIGGAAFAGCTHLTSIAIPEGVTSIEIYAFAGCSHLTSFTIPNSVTRIGNSAFESCRGLTSIMIPDGVNSIETGAFKDCSGLTSVTIPNSVTSIGSAAFYGCTGLTSVAIPNGVQFIGTSTFEFCSGLTSVTIPNSMVGIGDATFEYCSRLTSVTIPNSVTRIGASAFAHCPLEFAVFTGNAPSMGTNVFAGAADDFCVYFFDAATGFTRPKWNSYPVASLGPIGEGQLRAFTAPAGAAQAGARWRVDGGEWHKSGVIVGGLSAGTHSVSFKNVGGRATPSTQLFTVSGTQRASVTGVYHLKSGGTFTGMLDEGGGLVKLTITSSGNFTGILILRGSSYRLQGAFDASGNYLNIIGNPPVRLALHIDPSQIGGNPGELPVTGSIGGQEFVACHAAYDRDDPAEIAGKYTLLLPPVEVGAPQDNAAILQGNAGFPQGAGYARMTVNSAGNVTMSGKLADNTNFSASGPIVGGTGGTEFYLYNPTLYGGKGLLAGALTFENLPNSQCDATLQWFKPMQKSGGYFKNGFDTDLNLIGARYPQGRLTLHSPSTPGIMTLIGGSLAGPLIESVTLIPVSQVRVEGANLEKLKVSLDLSAGLFRGSFLHPATKKTVSFGGVLYQRDPNDQAGGPAAAPEGNDPVPAPPLAEGFFLGPIIDGEGWSGDVSLTL